MDKSKKPILKKPLISYTGVVLDERSVQLLKKKFDYYISPLTPMADHMTIVVGELRPDEKEILGQEVELLVNELGQGDGVVAAGVKTDIVVYDKKPHITLAVEDGIRPAASNEITNWRPIRHPFTVRGVIKEVPAGLTESDAENQRGVLDAEDADPALTHSSYSPMYPITTQNGANALMEGTEKVNNIVQALNTLPFKDAVYRAGGQIYAVGGVVRDALVDKSSSDLDIVIRGIPAKELLVILKKYGWADINGTNFDTINFKGNKNVSSKLRSLGFEDVIDIALPRIDKAGDSGKHSDIVANVDHSLPIETDLERRDFTINSMAMKPSGEIIDPFGGAQDLKNGIIKWTNKKAFLDDPLRTIRAIRFAAVFGYDLDDETREAISQHVGNVNKLPKERLIKEFKKLESKGGGEIYQRAYRILVETNAFEVIFGFKPIEKDIPLVERLGDFVYSMVRSASDRPEIIFTRSLKGDNNTAKYIKALNFTETKLKKIGDAREIAANMYAIHPDSLTSPLVTGLLKEAANELLNGNYPKAIRELAINGNDIIKLGYSGKELGDTLLRLFNAVLHDKVPNEANALLSAIGKKGAGEPNVTVNDLMEAINAEVGVKHLIVLDMDKTMLVTPEPEDGKPYWLKKTGNVYPHIGWWSRAESLDPEVFGDVIKPRPDIKAIYDKYIGNPKVMIMLLTNRQDNPKIVNNALYHLNKFYPDIEVIDGVSFLTKNESKIKRITYVLKEIPSIETVDFYDDQASHFEDSHILDSFGVRHTCHAVSW